jgi:hypothetical protein
MTVWTDRIALARKGWLTEIGINRNGIASSNATSVACGYWARTQYWTGFLTDICIHDHVIVDLAVDGAYDKIASMTQSVSETIARAEQEFTQTIPCVNGKRDSHGNLQLFENVHETQYAQSRPRTYFPTEDIPLNIEDTAITNGPDHLDRLISAARAKIWTIDNINPHFGFARYAKDCQDRRWGYRLRMAKRLSGDTKVSFKPKEMTVESLNEQLISPMIGSFHTAIDASFELYAPGGLRHGHTSNGLPPGDQTLADALTERNIHPPG